MIQLMQEYLDAEQLEPGVSSAALAPVLRSVAEELSSIAAVGGVWLRLVGVPAPPHRRRTSRGCELALQYLIGSMIEAQPASGKVMFLLGEGPAGAVLRGAGECGFRQRGAVEAHTAGVRPRLP